MLSALLNPAHYTLSWFALPTAAVLLAVLLLGGLAPLREGRTFVSASFVLVTLTVGVWLFSYTALYLANDPVTARGWAHLSFVGVPAIPAAAYQFTCAVLHPAARRQPSVALLWLVAAVFAAAGLATDTLVAGLYHYWWGFYPRYGWLGLPFSLCFCATIGACLVLYAQAYRTIPPGVPRLRILWFGTAFALATPGLADFAAVWGLPIYPVGYLALLAFLLVAATAIWRYHLVDLTPAFAAAQILATMTDALLVLDPAGVIRLVNPAAVALLGIAPEALRGRALAGVLPGTPLDGGLAAPAAPLRDHELAYQPPAGPPRWVSLSWSVLTGRHGEPVALVCILQDLTVRAAAAEEIRHLHATLEARIRERTALLQAMNSELEHEIGERRRAEAALQQLATLDALTGLGNRRALERRLAAEIARSVQFGHPLAVLVLDVDHFKQVNDRYGHLLGDAVLSWVAGCVQASVRATDGVTRYGGEEFVVVLPETPPARAQQLAEQIRRRVAAEPYRGPSGAGAPVVIPLTVSIGVAAFPADGPNQAGLIAAGDAALYAAKRGGRNRTVPFWRLVGADSSHRANERTVA